MRRPSLPGHQSSQEMTWMVSALLPQQDDLTKPRHIIARYHGGWRRGLHPTDHTLRAGTY